MAIDTGLEESVDKFKAAMKSRAELVKSNEGQAIANVCMLIENTAKKGMRDTEIDPDKMYKSGKNRDIIHYASREGAYPAVDTGTLRQSITHDISKNEASGGVVGRIGTKLIYGAYLEHGTSRMAPRPWLGPSITINKEKIYSILKSVFQKSNIGEVE